MPFKVNISHQGKTLKKETENEELIGKKIGETIDGKEISSDLVGYELEITGTSDMAGFPGKKDIEGSMLKRVLLKKGFSLKTKPKGLKKHPIKMPDGLRFKKSVRGNTISKDTIQINTAIRKEGSSKFEEMLPKKEVAEKKAEEVKTEKAVEEKKEEKPIKEKEEVKKEVKEEVKADGTEKPAETLAQ